MKNNLHVSVERLLYKSAFLKKNKTGTHLILPLPFCGVPSEPWI